MWNETIIWLSITIIFTIISIVKQKYFLKNKSFFKDTETLLKTREKHIKTIEEQKAFLRAKNNLGKDFITMVFSLITFYLAFILLIYPRLENLYTGLIVVVIYSIIFSFIYAKFMLEGKHFTYSLINAFMNYIYTGSFLVYVKFMDTIPGILLLLISIALMILTGYLLEKFWTKVWQS